MPVEVGLFRYKGDFDRLYLRQITSVANKGGRRPYYCALLLKKKAAEAEIEASRVKAFFS